MCMNYTHVYVVGILAKACIECVYIPACVYVSILSYGITQTQQTPPHPHVDASIHGDVTFPCL